MILEMAQASDFYRSLSDNEKHELCEAIAEDIFFLDEKLQEKIIKVLHETEPEISGEIRRINRFTSEP